MPSCQVMPQSLSVTFRREAGENWGGVGGETLAKGANLIH